MGPRTFCFHFLKKNPLGCVYFVLFLMCVFIFLTLNGIPLSHRIAYRLSKLSVSESGVALAGTLGVKLLQLTGP